MKPLANINVVSLAINVPGPVARRAPLGTLKNKSLFMVTKLANLVPKSLYFWFRGSEVPATLSKIVNNNMAVVRVSF